MFSILEVRLSTVFAEIMRGWSRLLGLPKFTLYCTILVAVYIFLTFSPSSDGFNWFSLEPKDGLPKECNTRLVGAVNIEVDPKKARQWPTHALNRINKGGWTELPPDCKAKKTVAVIIPFRNSYTQLKMLMYHLHPFLQSQRLAYRIFVVEQLPKDPYNRGALINIGFKHAQLMEKYDCFIFHDVDLLPESDYNDYGCVSSPRHHATMVDVDGYQPRQATDIGGVLSMDAATMTAINGMSNLYFGSNEVDDLYLRLQKKKYHVSRPKMAYSRYTRNPIPPPFKSPTSAPKKFLQDTSTERMGMDGLSSLKYHEMETVEQPLYTIIRVEVKKSDYAEDIEGIL